MTDKTLTTTAKILKFPITRQMNERLAGHLFREMDARINAEIAEVKADVLRKEKEQFGTNDLALIGRQLMNNYFPMGAA